MSRPSVFIVIPNWNGKDLLADCLGSLESQTLKADICVVDNGSSDGSVQFLKKHYPKIKLIKLDKNYGFTGGVNAGIKYALDNNYEFIALFNNDATADKNWLKFLVEAMKKDDSGGIATGKFLLADKKHIDSTGDIYTTWGISFPRGRGEIDRGQYNEAGYVFGATGGASLYRAKMLKEIGLFDEVFFAYFEDIDISFRAQLAGWKVYYQPLAVSYHKLGATSGRLGSFSRYHSVKNFILIYTKNMPAKLYWKYLPLFWVQLVRMKLGAIRDHQLGVYIKSVLKALSLLPNALGQRRSIQRRRTVKPSYIDKIIHHGRPPKPIKL